MSQNIHKVIENRKLTESTFILKFERNGLEFSTGQHLGVGPANGLRTREYSVYSGEREEYVEILVKEVIDGVISPQLSLLNPGDEVVVDHPDGHFHIAPHINPKSKHVFIATGTGIAPFHSFIKTNPDLDYLIIHGVKTAEESYGKEDYSPDNYIVCTSQDNTGLFKGRVTDYIRQNNLGRDNIYYLCGNSNMIHDMYDILEEQKVPFDAILSEVYF